MSAAGRIDGKRALVTGAGAGIGRAAALRFAREGARVGVLDVDAEAAARVVAEIREAGGQGLALPADVTVEAQVAGAVKQMVAAWGGLDVVVANAAVELFGADARVDELPAEVWRRTLDVNL